MENERYGDTQSIKLLRQLTHIKNFSVPGARKLFVDVLQARLSDIVVADPVELVRSATDVQIAGLQKGMYTFISMMAGAGADGFWPPLGLSSVQCVITRGDMQLRITGKITAMLTVKIYALLGRVGTRLRRCECGELFVKVKRQKTCSTSCQKRFYMRDYPR